MAYLRFIWFKMKQNDTGETWVTRWAENADNRPHWADGIAAYALEKDSVIIGGPFKTRKEAMK